MEAKRGAIHSEQATTGQAKDLSSSDDKGSVFAVTGATQNAALLPGLVGKEKTPGKLTVEPGTGMSLPHAPPDTREGEVTLANAHTFDYSGMSEEAFEEAQSRLAQEADTRMAPLLARAAGYQDLIKTLQESPSASADEVMEEVSATNPLAQEDPAFARGVINVRTRFQQNAAALQEETRQRAADQAVEPEVLLYRSMIQSIEAEAGRKTLFRLSGMGPREPVELEGLGTALCMTVGEKDLERFFHVSGQSFETDQPYTKGAVAGITYRANPARLFTGKQITYTPVDTHGIVPIIVLNGSLPEPVRNLYRDHELAHSDQLIQRNALKEAGDPQRWAEHGIQEFPPLLEVERVAGWNANPEAMHQDPVYRSLLDYGLAQTKDELLATIRANGKNDTLNNFSRLLFGCTRTTSPYFPFRPYVNLSKQYPNVYHALQRDYHKAIDLGALSTIDLAVANYRSLGIRDRIPLLGLSLAHTPVTQWGSHLTNNGFAQEVHEWRDFDLAASQNSPDTFLRQTKTQMIEQWNRPVTTILNTANRMLRASR